jgi:PBP1b-binding outer membrane lipoprotein LpoB
MKTLNLSIIALAAAMLTGCSFGGTNDEPVTAAPIPVATPTTTTTVATPVSAKPQENIQRSGAHIDASAFLNALVDSGCQIDNAEYKEVKRGGAIKVVCSKTVDALNVELEDL